MTIQSLVRVGAAVWYRYWTRRNPPFCFPGGLYLATVIGLGFCLFVISDLRIDIKVFTVTLPYEAKVKGTGSFDHTHFYSLPHSYISC